MILFARFREVLERELVVTRTQERALTAYLKDTFKALMAPVSVAPSTLKRVRDYQRMLIAGTNFEVPDRRGRITIPPILRSHAGLERSIVMIGAMNRIEVQDAEHRAECQAEQESGFAELDAGLLSQLGQ